MRYNEHCLEQTKCRIQYSIYFNLIMKYQFSSNIFGLMNIYNKWWLRGSHCSLWWWSGPADRQQNYVESALHLARLARCAALDAINTMPITHWSLRIVLVSVVTLSTWVIVTASYLYCDVSRITAWGSVLKGKK